MDGDNFARFRKNGPTAAGMETAWPERGFKSMIERFHCLTMKIPV
jgi:hypothetical protein